MKPETRDNIEYRARIYKDDTLIPKIEEDLKVLVQVILGEKRTLDIQRYNQTDEEACGFDTYPSCKHWEKKFCRCSPKKYMGRIPELGYVFFGDSHTDIYCEVIKSFIGRRIIIPFSY